MDLKLSLLDDVKKTNLEFPSSPRNKTLVATFSPLADKSAVTASASRNDAKTNEA